MTFFFYFFSIFQQTIAFCSLCAGVTVYDFLFYFCVFFQQTIPFCSLCTGPCLSYVDVEDDWIKWGKIYIQYGDKGEFFVRKTKRNASSSGLVVTALFF